MKTINEDGRLLYKPIQVYLPTSMDAWWMQLSCRSLSSRRFLCRALRRNFLSFNRCSRRPFRRLCQSNTTLSAYLSRHVNKIVNNRLRARSEGRQSFSSCPDLLGSPHLSATWHIETTRVCPALILSNTEATLRRPMEAFWKLSFLRIMARPPALPVTLPSSPVPPAEPAYEGTPITSQRSLRQLSIFLLGGACLLASTAITRKAVWRRQLRVKPKFYEPNTNPHEYFSPFHDAIQALNLATMNCASVGVMAVGGIMWSFDVANLREAQASLRRRLNYDSIYGSEDDIPRNLSELIAKSGEMRIAEEEKEENNEEKKQ